MAPHKVSHSSLSSDASSDMWQVFPSPTQSETATQEPRAAEPIAIVGMGCRLPGDVSGASSLWELLEQGRTGQCGIPAGRFNIDGFYHPLGADRPGSMNTKGGYFLKEDIRHFDNDFFGINPMEATYMDPQQRKLLEVVYEALETGGASLKSISGSNTGCYVGNFTVDFQVMQTRDPEYLHRYSATGMGTTILSNRISHVFNLQGPSLVIDTACSSSLYCLHIACGALEARECNAAIVAGANLIQSPEQHIGTMKAGVLSATSTCHTFSDDADGYGRADGIGCLYIKRLSDAIQNNDPIHSVIVGTAVNSNGKTPGITLPSAIGQEAVIRKAYQKAGRDLSSTQYVEAHGTGTPVGDPIEVDAISRVFNRPEERPLLIGSVKTNLGHSEAASGISSIIKTTLALKNRRIPATVGIRNINPKISKHGRGIKAVTQNLDWPGDIQSIRRAGVNSFGYGGANAHVILESAEHHLPLGYSRYAAAATAQELCRTKSQAEQDERLYLLPFSASHPMSLEARVTDLGEYLKHHDVSIRDLAYTLGLRRSHLSNRGYIITKATELRNAVSVNYLQSLPNLLPASSVDRFGFVFTGQGAQWEQMGKDLFSFKVFADAISEMDDALRSLTHPPSWSIGGALFEPSGTSLINEVTHSQPLCTAIQVGLVLLLRSQGIEPSVLIGHSSGEIAAAFAAGILTSAQAIMIAYYRGYVVSKLPSAGAMIVVGLDRDSAELRIEEAGLRSRITVACINSPESVTISGETPAIDSLLDHLQAQNVFARKLKTGGRAYHSHQMLAIGSEYEDLIDREISKLEASVRLPKGAQWISSVTKEPVTKDIRGAYWRSNLESPVLFADAFERLTREGNLHLIEIGPHSALELPIKQLRSKLQIAELSMPYSTAMVRGKNCSQSVFSMLGHLYLHGFEVSFGKVNGLTRCSKGDSEIVDCNVLTDLPPYKWNYDTILWSECRTSSEFRTRKHKRHELLGSLIPGTNGQVHMWRNLIRLSDIPWIVDHKLQETVVFPGAGYLAMAIEALNRVMPQEARVKHIELESINMLDALIVSDEVNSSVELFTTMRRRPITSVTVSSDWWDFSIVSFKDNLSTTHATGSVRPRSLDLVGQQSYQPLASSLELTAPRVWYDKLTKSGLNFGPSFQSIKEFNVARLKKEHTCRSRVPLIQNFTRNTKLDEYYPVHPITLDAMLQTSIVATTAGVTGDLKAKIPVKFGHVFLDLATESSSREMYIDATAHKVGFAAWNVNAELRNDQGYVKVKFNDVRLAPYDAVDQIEVPVDRHPMLRSLWKPDTTDLGLIEADGFTDYLNGFVEESHSDFSDEGILKLGAALDMLSHKEPSMKVLEIGNDIVDISNAAISLLHGQKALKLLQSYTTGCIADDGTLIGATVDIQKGRIAGNNDYHPIVGEEFDLILLPFTLTSDSYLLLGLDFIKRLMRPGSKVLALSASSKKLNFSCHKLTVVESPLNNGEGRVVLAQKSNSLSGVPSWHSKHVAIVDRGINYLSRELEFQLADCLGRPVPRVSLNEVSDVTIPPGTVVFSLIESERPLLASITDDQMKLVKVLTNNASSIVWVTAGDLLGHVIPEYGLVSGLSRALMLEQPSLNFFTFDIDDISRAPKRSARNLIAVLDQRKNSRIDFEFVQSKDLVHVNRFIPDDGLNESFRSKQGSEVIQMQLGQAKPLQLSIEKVGQFDSIYFKQIANSKVIGPRNVQVSVLAVGLNAKDLYALGGRVDTRDATCALEFAGVVERVGTDSTTFCVGDRVVVMAPSHFKTSEIVPEWACQKLEDNESYEVMSTLCVAYGTAIYALHDRARLQAGESVMIHSATGGVGIAAIQIAQLAGAEIFATVSNDLKKQYLVGTFGLKPENIFNSRDDSFLAGVMERTKWRGVDVVLNSLVGDLLHAGWLCCAPFGRFIEIGKKDLTDSGRLEMSQFLKNVTFSAFDLSNLYYSHSPAANQTWSRLMKDTLTLFRKRQITKIEPLEVFDISDLTKAFRLFSSGNRMGRIAINLENPASKLRVQPYRYTSKFNPHKYYIMVGCLGGLGRSISKWMVRRGARKFIFLGRSGLDKAPARALVQDLEIEGASCQVVCGDVVNMKDVQATIDCAEGPLGGVVQAAMGLDETLFTTMSTRSWHTGIDPKVVGTWNLHRAVENYKHNSELEFFLMTSSVSGSVGTATESNYCAANHFLDLFARYRRSLGLPATSIGLGMISEVGYLHENPEIEALLLRKGIQAINEEELLRIIDISLSDNKLFPHAYDYKAEAHILTGLEPFGLKELRNKGFEGNSSTLNDPRASILAQALDGGSHFSIKNEDGIPIDICKAVEGGSSLKVATLDFISKRFSNLVLLPMSKVDIKKPLAQYGMDSMIAAEFRTWFFHAFKVDIPFLELLSKSVTISSLSETVLKNVK